MLRTVLLLSSICGLVRSSGIAVAPVGPAEGPLPVANAPVVTAASSQYFERTFNRLVVPQPIPVAPVAPPPLAPVPVAPAPVPPAPTVFIAPTQSIPVAVNPPPPSRLEPNVAIAVATAHAAAPVATFLLPPYPFGFPPNFGVLPSEEPTNAPDQNTKESTTPRTTETEATTPQPESTTPIDTSSSDNSFVQALPSNENVNFNLYGPPPRPQFQPSPAPQQPGPQFRPQQPNPQFQPQQPRPQYNPNQGNHFQPQQPRPQFNQNQPNPQFQPQQPRPQFNQNQPNPQFQPQQPQFPPFPPQQQQPLPQFRPQQQPEFPPYPPHQQPQSAFRPQPKPQQPRPQYQQPWPQQRGKPQKLKTSVEVVPVPLAYITPPPLHKPKTHAHVKVVKHIYTYVPASSTKIILKPVKIRPVRLVKHKVVGVRSQNLRANARDIEITTFNPFPRPNTKPPRV